MITVSCDYLNECISIKLYGEVSKYHEFWNQMMIEKMHHLSHNKRIQSCLTKSIHQAFLSCLENFILRRKHLRHIFHPPSQRVSEN